MEAYVEELTAEDVQRELRRIIEQLGAIVIWLDKRGMSKSGSQIATALAYTGMAWNSLEPKDQ